MLLFTQFSNHVRELTSTQRGPSLIHVVVPPSSNKSVIIALHHLATHFMPLFTQFSSHVRELTSIFPSEISLHWQPPELGRPGSRSGQRDQPEATQRAGQQHHGGQRDDPALGVQTTRRLAGHLAEPLHLHMRTALVSKVSVCRKRRLCSTCCSRHYSA